MFVRKSNGCSELKGWMFGIERTDVRKEQYGFAKSQNTDVRKKINWMFGIEKNGCSEQKIANVRKIFAWKFGIEMNGCSERTQACLGIDL
jgi:hypothetical protein